MIASKLPREFAERLRAAPRRGLLLDYDGTLAPFRADRAAALPYAGVLELLTEIQASGATRLVLISGRGAEDLAALLAPAPAPEIWGSHGWERRLPDGTHADRPLAAEVRARLAAAAEALRTAGHAEACECKPAAVAVHWRGAAAALRAARRGAAERLWRPLTGDGALRLVPFDGGLELRAAGQTKGDAVTTLLAELGPGAAVAYLGDDTTDEDAFAAIDGRGLGVLVRPRARPSGAAVWLRPPEGLLAFLRFWLAASGAGR